MNHADDSKPNPYARPSAYPRMLDGRMMIAGGRYPPKARAAERQPLRTASSTAGILSGSALPMTPPSVQPGATPRAEAPRAPSLLTRPMAAPTPARAAAPGPVPAADPPPAPDPELEPAHTVSTLEIEAPLAMGDVLARASGGRSSGRSFVPAAVAIGAAVAGLGVLLYVTRPNATRPPPAAPAAQPVAANRVAAPAPQRPEPAAVSPPPEASSPPPARVARAPRPAKAPAAAAAASAPAPTPELAAPALTATDSAPPPVIAAPEPLAIPPAGPPPRPAKAPPSDPNAPISTHAPDPA